MEKNKIIYFIIIIGLFFLIYSFLNINNSLNKSFESKSQSSCIQFKNIEKNIYITKRRWGLAGQHFHLVISSIDHTDKHIPINKEKEIVLDNRCGLYYKKQEPDSLILILPSDSKKEIYRNIDKIKVKILEIENSIYVNLKNNYKELGLNLISCD